MVNINLYNTLTSTYFRPVDFNVIGDQFALKQTSLYTNEGLDLNLYEFLKDSQDFSINKKTCLFLTSPNYNSNILENKGDQDDNTNFTLLNTPLTSQTGGVLRLSAIYNNFSYNTEYVLYDSYQNIFAPSDSLTFNFDNGLVYIEDNNGNYLTVNGLGESNLIFTKKTFPFNQSQQFDYVLGLSGIVLFQSGTNFKNIVIKNNTNNYILSSFKFSNNINLPNNSILSFVSYTSSYIDSNNDIVNSFLTKYNVNPISSGNSLEIDENYRLSNPLSQNYLAMLPIEYPTINDQTATYPIQLHGLKNYQTSDYTYSTGTSYITGSKAIRRLYNKIYTGTNQTEGYESVFLGYQSNTKVYQFDSDAETVFFYPPTSERLPISASGLIEDGAVANNTPFLSDKVYVLNKNYQELTPGVPQPSSINLFNNSFLCSWLSGTTFGNKTWVDRYYNAAFYTLDHALTSKTLVYNDRYNADKPYLFDVPSTMVFEPGIIYRYQRVGKNNSLNFITGMDKSESLILSVTSWENTPLIDNSSYSNNGLVFFSNPENFQKTYFVLTGQDHVVFPSNSILLQRNELTCSIWVYQDDWNNVYGDQILGNYYNSGFGLINEGSFNAPLMTLIDNASGGFVYNLNYQFTNLSEIPLLSANPDSSFITHRMPDYSYWVFDVKYNKFYHFNALNNLILSVDYSSYNTNAVQVEVDSKQNFYLFDKDQQKFIYFNNKGVFKGLYRFFQEDDGIVNRIELDKNDDIVRIYGTSSVIDNENNIWEVIGGNLYKNRQVFANVGQTQQITCDSNNNIWLSHLYDTISILNTKTNIFYFSQRIGEGSALPKNTCLGDTKFRFLDFVKIPKQTSSCDQNVTYQDALVIIDNIYNYAYLIDNNGLLLARLNIRALPKKANITNAFTAFGDFTGYQFLRKYSGKFKNFTWKFKIDKVDGSNPQLLSLRYPLSSLKPGWHNFTFNFNSYKGFANYYVDSVQVDSVNFRQNQFLLTYDYRSSILLGAATVENTTLNDILGLDNSYKFIGKVADLKIYKNTLFDYQIEQLYLSSEFSPNFGELKWNKNVGNRNFIEEVAYWYKMQLPGSKSKYFNINVHNLNISDENKQFLENSIKNVMKKMAPAESSLYKINWM